MCGIAGLILRDSRERPKRETLSRMGQSISHRGPDASGISVNGPVGLVHQRLSIIDLSDAGTQPMSNDNGTLIVVFNGEIYNFKELRSSLQDKHRFRSQTDTEVLLYLYKEHGEAMVDLLDGMFAFCIFDVTKNRLFLARDPFGIKPLYFAFDDRRFVFGSELKSLLASGTLSRRLSPEAVNDFFDFHWIPSPRTIFADAQSMEPAHCMTVDLDAWTTSTRRYWSPAYQPRTDLSLGDWVEAASAELANSVRAQLVADVPLGVFLSGGIDSSLVTHFTAKAGRDVATAFTVDFDDAQQSELVFAQDIVRQTSLRHVVRTCSSDLMGTLSSLMQFYDEPFADSSMLPTHAVAGLARQEVKVVLAGDGGDELFSGYHHHHLAHSMGKLGMVPDSLLSAAGHAVSGLARTLEWPRVEAWSSRIGRSKGERIASIARLPAHPTRRRILASSHREPDEARWWCVEKFKSRLSGLPAVTQAQMFDLLFYLPNDMLTKVDRASMAHGLEVRVPLLTRRMQNLAFAISESIRFSPTRDKLVLRKLCETLYGAQAASRPKKGFSIPLRRWMLNAIRDGVYGRIQGGAAMNDGWLDPAGLRDLVAAVKRGPRSWTMDRSDELFATMVFHYWYERYSTNEVDPPQNGHMP